MPLAEVITSRPVQDDAALLRVEGLTVRFRTPGGWVTVVDDISFAVKAGETLGLVGESGSGKTITSLAVLGLLEIPPAEVAAGKVIFEGRDLLALSESDLSNLRGARLSMVFQEPMTSLNPLMTVGRQIEEPLRRHLGLSSTEARVRAVELLGMVGLPRPADAAESYPHQLSGGMRQRVMIAIALSCRPALLVADEPTTALDVSVQAQILALLDDLQREIGAAILLITHDLAVIAETAHRVAVMYAGRIVETGPVETLFARPLHPYTEGLLRSIPRIERDREEFLPEIAGVVPAPWDLPSGCAFAPRCAHADQICVERRPGLADQGHERAVACWKPLHA
jgi:oligopeptide/dipeptide ABC transporter ATP-binding protein